MNLLDTFLANIKKKALFAAKDRLLIAVSGGVDSMVLLDLCVKAGYNISIAHCNFQLRGAESDADEQWVQSMAQKYSLPFHVAHFDTTQYAKLHKLSIQVAARNLRYQWFDKLLQGFKNETTAPHIQHFLLTAHHADDNIETVLMNFFKGTGIKGLTGIPEKQNHIVRPLLFASKEELLQYANTHHILFREDSSNQKNEYSRNFFRNELIPSIERVFPQVRENMVQSIAHFNNQYALYNSAAEQRLEKLWEEKNGEWHIPLLKLKKQPGMAALLYELSSRFGFSSRQQPELLRLLEAGSGKFMRSQTHRFLVNRNWLIISENSLPEHSIYTVEEADEKISIPPGILHIQKLSEPPGIQNSRPLAQLDARHIQFPLLIRKWRQADYFYPLGMQKKKKLSRFFIDQKLSVADKEKIFVIESNKKIIWIIGHRIDDRFKIIPSTTNTLILSLTPAAP